MQPDQFTYTYPRAVAWMAAIIQPPVYFALLLGGALIAQALA